MDSYSYPYQGFVARKLLAQIGPAVVAFTAASSSAPSPFLDEDASYLSASSFDNTSSGVKPTTAVIVLLLIFIAFFLLGLLSVHFQRWYAAHDATQIGHGNGPLLQGLDASILNTLPKVIFSSSSSIQMEKKKERAAAECAICLEEFSEQETLRLLPYCGHTFHLECINMWLFSHTTCPLCRLSLLHPETIAIAVGSPNDDVIEQPRNDIGATAMAVNLAAMETMQMGVQENPKNRREELGESSEYHAELQRSHSTGHSLDNEGQLRASSLSSFSSSSLARLTLTADRSGSYRVVPEARRDGCSL